MSSGYLCMNRKQAVYVLILFAHIVSCSSTKKLALQPGCTLQYDLVANQKSLRVDVKLLESSPKWKFDYVIQEDNLAAQLSSSSRAVKSSTELYHNFNGSDKMLNSSTALRLSDSTFQSLKNGDSAEISYRIGFVKNTYAYRVVENQKIKILINGKQRPLNVLYIEDLSDKSLALWVWDNPTTPLIFRHNLGYEMVINQMYIP